MNNQVVINTFGCCIIRDIISFDRFSQFQVNCNIQNTTPWSIYNQKFCPTYSSLDANKFTWGSPWQKRMLEYELKKSAFDVLKISSCDYMLVDLGDFRLKIKELMFEGNIYYTTFSEPYSKNLGYLEKLEKGCEKKIISSFELEESYVLDSIKQYSDNILECVLGDVKKIIFVELKLSDYFLSQNKEVISFNGTYGWFDIAKTNAFIDKCTKIFVQHLKPFFTIPIPKNIIADECHKWGKMPLHYIDIYYEYALECLQLIVNRKQNNCEINNVIFEKKKKVECLINELILNQN